MKQAIKKAIKTMWPALLVGIILGVPLGFYGPKLFTEDFAGEITGKRLDAERLMLMISMPQGEVLATFTQKIDEIDFLVNTGDEMELGLVKYTPLVEDPTLVRVTHSEIVASSTFEDTDTAPTDEDPATPSDKPDEEAAGGTSTDDESTSSEPTDSEPADEEPADEPGAQDGSTTS